jgi:hypothetical protein
MPTAELAQYFVAERQGGFLLVTLALAGFGLAAFLWFSRSAFLAMAWPLVVLGLFELIVGLTVALRTPDQVAALESGFATARIPTLSAETQRMDKVNRNFKVIKIAEVACIVLGVLLAVLLPHPNAGAAVGLGLLLEASILLVFDAFAHHRALLYTQWLHSLSP